MGGTNIDGVIIDKGKIIKSVKRPTNREDLFGTIWSTLKELLDGFDKSKIERINLSTTISTNAIVEKKTSTVGMIIEPGPGMPYAHLACGDENVFISGYIDHRGNVIDDVNISEIKEASSKFKEKRIESFAVVGKFSTRNPEHEIKIKKLLEEEIADSTSNNPPIITLGHTMSGKLNFPRRVFTSYLNSAVYSTFKEFAENIKGSMEREGISAPIFILKADGGTMSIDRAIEKPVETILSGPAASFMGISAMLPTDKDAVLLDVGGTTTDIFFLADGVPLFEPLGIKIDKYKTLVRAIFTVSIGLGGDSAIEIEKGKLKIGPIREGTPYAFGGPKPTPTDAMIVLGLLDDEVFQFFRDDRDIESVKIRAYNAMEALGKELNKEAKEMATLILDTMADMIKSNIDQIINEINQKPVYTIKELLYGKKLQPQLINIIGGPAKVLSPILEEKFKLPCYYPENFQIANAIGAALSRPTTEITMHVDTSKKILSVPELNLYEKVSSRFDLNTARKRALDLVKEGAKAMGASEKELDTEIVEESCFNMVRGFYTIGQNIRIKAQIKPGLIYQIRGDKYAQS
jgi:N-methylhydantoinase A/oxoprolinase/acetone carboxylase beta subunit